jgi:Domain of unknown function (DUF4333)
VPVASRSVRRCLALLAAATVATASLAVAGSALAGSAGAAELARTPARRAVERSVHAAYPDLVFGNVACPSGITRKRGVKFTCTVQLPGTFLVVEALQTDGNGNVSLSTQQAVIPSQLLRQFVAVNSSLPATVDCGPAPWRVARPGEKITCGVTLADGTTRTVELTVQDTAGNVTVTAVT